MSSAGKSTLTEEQRRRMEENRLQAIAKRNAAIARNNALFSAQNQTQPQPVAAVVAPRLSATTAQAQAQTQNISQQYLGSNRNPQPTNNATNYGTNFNVNKPLPAPVQAANFKVSKIPFNGKTVSGTCTMISRDRFMVDMGYQAEAIAVFKSITGSTYGEQYIV